MRLALFVSFVFLSLSSFAMQGIVEKCKATLLVDEKTFSKGEPNAQLDRSGNSFSHYLTGTNHKDTLTYVFHESWQKPETTNASGANIFFTAIFYELLHPSETVAENRLIMVHDILSNRYRKNTFSSVEKDSFFPEQPLFVQIENAMLSQIMRVKLDSGDVIFNPFTFAMAVGNKKIIQILMDTYPAKFTVDESKHLFEIAERYKNGDAQEILIDRFPQLTK